MAEPKTNADTAMLTPTAPATPSTAVSPPLNEHSLSAVKFLKPWGIYNAGEVAGFDTHRAQWLLEHKLATPA